MELCPTLEEFCDILGCDSTFFPILPPVSSINVPHDLASLLGVPIGLASRFTHGGLVNLQALITFYRYPKDIRDQAYADARGVALALCIVSEFLFSSNSGAIMRICLSLRDHGNPMGIVLAKTFHGLDASAENGVMLSLSSHFSSPGLSF